MTEHYRKHTINPIDVIVDHGLCFNLGNVIKYILRHRYKDGRKDLIKALWYLVHHITKNSDTADGVITMVSEQAPKVQNYNTIAIVEGTRNWGKDFYSKLKAGDCGYIKSMINHEMLNEAGVTHIPYNSMMEHILTDVFETVDWEYVATTIADDMERLK